MGDNDTKELLKACAQNLLNAVSQLDNCSRDPPSTQPSTQPPAQPSVQSAAQPSAVEEHRRLFGYKPPSSSCRSKCNKPQPKRRVVTTTNGERLSIPVRNTWTRTFVCLQKKNAITAPSTIEKVNMALAGLEEKSICFTKGGNSEHVHEKILEAYPMLEKAGGYEILRTGERGSRQLLLLAIPPGGYTVTYLKSTIASAKGYLRPLQRDILINSSAVAEQGQTQISMSPKVACLDCHQTVSMDSIRSHRETCGRGCSSVSNLSCRDDTSIADLPLIDGESLQEDGFIQLQRMFPNVGPDMLKEAVDKANGSVSIAAEALLDGSAAAVVNIEVDSDSELERSPFNDILNVSSGKVQTVKDLMDGHKQQLMLEGIERIRINREDLWSESIAIFKNPKFNSKASPLVTFEGELGIDGGGLRKEFGSLLRAKIFSPEAKLFEGIEHRKMPIFSIDGIQSRLFQVAGKMVSYLITHLDIGIPFISPPVYQYIVHGTVDAAASSCTIEDICDFDYQELIAKVISAKSEDEIAVLKNDALIDCLINAGWLGGISLTNRDIAVQTVMVHFILHKRMEPIDQFCKGLNNLGILKLVRSHPELMEKYFIKQDMPLASEDILGLLTLDCDEEPLDEKSLRAYDFLHRGIRQLEQEQGSDGLSKLLKYMTSLAIIPPLGFEKKIEVDFDCTTSSFFAETCGLVLRVPTTHKSFETFMSNLLEAVENNTGFGSV